MRRRPLLMLALALVAAGSLSVAGCGGGSASTKVSSAKDRVVVGYYADWDMYVRGFPIYLPLSEGQSKRLFDAAHITHMNYAFAKIDYVQSIVSDRKVVTTTVVVQPGAPSLPANTVGLGKLKAAFAPAPVAVSSGGGKTTFTIRSTGTFVDTSAAAKMSQLAIDFPQAEITTSTKVIPAKVKTTPTIVQVDQMTDPINFKNLVRLKKEFPKLKTLISIGGWTLSDKFSSSLATDGERAALARSALAYMKLNHFDGIDIDWEFPVCCGDKTAKAYAAFNNGAARYSPDDRHNLTLWLQELRRQLDDLGEKDGGVHYLLTIAASASPDIARKAYEFKELGKVLDWINVMAYDYHGAWEKVANHNAPLHQNPDDPVNGKGFNVVDSIALWEKEGVPASKLVMGVPFYGRGWDGCPPKNHGLFQTCKSASLHGGTWVKLDPTAYANWDYWDLKKNYVDNKASGYVRYWDAASGVPYLYNPKTQNWISYDDEQSIALKGKYIVDNGLKGGMFWEAATDNNAGLERTLYASVMEQRPAAAASAGK